MPDRSKDNQVTERFMSLLVANQKRIYTFIRYLVPNRNDADDILQETLAEMWKKFDLFEEGTSFDSWGMAIAKYKVLSYMQKKNKNHFHFGDNIIEILQKDSDAQHRYDNLVEKIDVLKKCTAKLSEREKELVSLRYEKGLTFENIAGRIGFSISAIHKNLCRIHSNLAKCVRLTIRLSEGGANG